MIYTQTANAKIKLALLEKSQDKNNKVIKRKYTDKVEPETPPLIKAAFCTFAAAKVMMILTALSIFISHNVATICFILWGCLIATTIILAIKQMYFTKSEISKNEYLKLKKKVEILSRQYER